MPSVNDFTGWQDQVDVSGWCMTGQLTLTIPMAMLTTWRRPDGTTVLTVKAGKDDVHYVVSRSYLVKLTAWLEEAGRRVGEIRQALGDQQPHP